MAMPAMNWILVNDKSVETQGDWIWLLNILKYQSYTFNVGIKNKIINIDL